MQATDFKTWANSDDAVNRRIRAELAQNGAEAAPAFGGTIRRWRTTMSSQMPQSTLVSHPCGPSVRPARPPSDSVSGVRAHRGPPARAEQRKRQGLSE